MKKFVNTPGNLKKLVKVLTFDHPETIKLEVNANGGSSMAYKRWELFDLVEEIFSDSRM